MTRRDRRGIVGAVCAMALALALARATLVLPHYGESRGPHERQFAIEAVRTSQALNLDAFVNFDYRGFDTLGEEFIFLVAIAGFSLILRERGGEMTVSQRPPIHGRRPRDGEVEIRLATYAYVPLALVYGIYMIVHGQLTPGGGFQGGVVLANGVLAIALGLGFPAFARIVGKRPSEATEAIGTLSYIGVGIGTLVTGGVFLRNALPHGTAGGLLSGGTIPLLNDGVGLAIAGGFTVLFVEFLEEMRVMK